MQYNNKFRFFNIIFSKENFLFIFLLFISLNVFSFDPQWSEIIEINFPENSYYSYHYFLREIGENEKVNDLAINDSVIGKKLRELLSIGVKVLYNKDGGTKLFNGTIWFSFEDIIKIELKNGQIIDIVEFFPNTDLYLRWFPAWIEYQRFIKKE